MRVTSLINVAHRREARQLLLSGAELEQMGHVIAKVEWRPGWPYPRTSSTRRSDSFSHGSSRSSIEGP